MKICVVHGSNRKGNTDKTIDIIKQTLNGLDEIVYTDFYLPKDLPYFCNGCFACLGTGTYAGQNCPHKQHTHAILESMLESDGILIASPSYALAETAQIKSLLDHFACTYMNHRPNEEMFDKVGFVVTTAAGAGTGKVINIISKNMLFWGIKRIVTFKANMWARDWDEMKEKRRIKIENNLRKKATKFYCLTKHRYSINASFSRRILRLIFARLVKGYADTEPDKIYWKAKGWI